MPAWISEFFANLVFILERLNWLSALDIFLVGLVIFAFLMLLRGTQAVLLLRGALLLIALLGLLTSFEVLPAFSWLVRTTLPAVLFAIPVIFAPEIRHALERLGRASRWMSAEATAAGKQDFIKALVNATSQLSKRKHGALIVLQRQDDLSEYISTGVYLDAQLTPELLLQIFYPSTPLHDGAVVMRGQRILAAACVLPLSASGVLTSTPDRQMGLRHRAALGISEVSDAVAVVVSEETGGVSVVSAGRMIRRLDSERLEHILRTFFPMEPRRKGLIALLRSVFTRNQNNIEEQQ